MQNRKGEAMSRRSRPEENVGGVMLTLSVVPIPVHVPVVGFGLWNPCLLQAVNGSDH